MTTLRSNYLSTCSGSFPDHFPNMALKKQGALCLDHKPKDLYPQPLM